MSHVCISLPFSPKQTQLKYFSVIVSFFLFFWSVAFRSPHENDPICALQPKKKLQRDKKFLWIKIRVKTLKKNVKQFVID